VKIVKKVGEQLLPSWLRAELKPVLAFTGAGTALFAGSVILAARGWAWLAERLNVWERLGVFVGAWYLALYGCIHAPDVARFAVPGAVVVWCAAAWWHAPPPARADPAEEPAEGTVEAFARWLLDLIGDRPGIHLRDLYPAMRKLPGHETRTDAELRTALKRLGIPVERSLRIGKLTGRSGVAVAAVRALPCRSVDEPVENDVDAGQGDDSTDVESPVERLVERVESA
jgi:hypothetical protein